MSPTPRTRPIHTPAGGPPQARPLSSAILSATAEAGIFELLAGLYRRLAQSELRALFPADMEAASRRSAAFFVQLLGGAPLYSEQYGPPRMRQRHLPFEIDERAREVWLACFDEALAEAVAGGSFPASELVGFRAFLEGFSSWMVNAR